MKVVITNLTNYNQYIDIDGKSDTNDTVHLGPKARSTVEIPTEKRFLQLSKQLSGKILLRKAQ